MRELKTDRVNVLRRKAWRRLKETGIRINRPRRSPVTKDFLIENVSIDPITKCWNWTKHKDSNGYGRVKHLGIDTRSHRVSWIIHNGNIPSGLFVCHGCDNPSCCNPEHLFLGTCRDNNIDCASKDRKGIKLNNNQAVEIFSDPRKYMEIAMEYGVSEHMVYCIKTGIRRTAATCL